MIYKKCIMTINKNNATLDEDIYLFRLDKNIELHFTIVNNKYKFDKSDLNNIIAQTNAAYFQIRLYRSDEIKYTFAIQPTQDGVAVLTITDDLIDDPIELGEYDFQISLLDADKTSMISMPIVKQQLHVCEPLVDNQAIMGKAVLGLTNLASGEIKNAFDSEGNYIREIHKDGDILSAQLVNKFEEALDTNTKASKDFATKKYVDDNTPIKSFPVNPTTKTGAVVVINNITSSGCYALPKRTDGKYWTNLIMRVMPSDGSGKGKAIMLNGYQNYVFYVNIETKKIYCDNLRIVYKIGATDDTTGTTDIYTEPYFLPTTNTKEFTPTKEYHPATKKYVDDNKIAYTISSKVLATVPASDIELDNDITASNVSINKDRRYYIEFLNSKKLCNLLISKENGNCIICSIGNYFIRANSDSTNISIIINKINTTDTTTDTFTDLVIYEEEVKYLDSKYLETDLVLQNSISLGRVGDIGAGSSAIGSRVTASGESSHAEGGVTTASGDGSHAEGSWTTASGYASHAEGSTTTASGVNSHAEGDYTTASGASSHAEGYGSKASSQFQHVQGKYNIEDTNRRYAHIVGNGAGDAKRSNAHTLDWKGNAWYAGEVQGTNLPYTVSSIVLATVPANNIKLDDDITINNITLNKDRKYYIEFLGSKKLCSVMIDKSHGELTCIVDNYMILGMTSSSNLILGVHKMSPDDTTDTFTDLVIYEEEIKCLDNKYLENDLTLQNSISLGRVGDIGTKSSAVGLDVVATGMASHAEGYGTRASGNFSHAEGNGAIASAEDSHAEGYDTIASSMYQHVQGKNNIEDNNDKYAHIVGNGEDLNNRSNAHTLDWHGNGWYAGKLSQEGTPTENKDLVTKKYVDNKVSSLPQLSFNEAGELVVTINGVSKTFVPKA